MEPMVKATKDAIIDYIQKDADATSAFVLDVYALLLNISPAHLTEEQQDLRGNLIDRAKAYLNSGT